MAHKGADIPGNYWEMRAGELVGTAIRIASNPLGYMTDHAIVKTGDGRQGFIFIGV